MRVLLILGVILFATVAHGANRLTETDKSDVLDYIKAIRARVTPPPANMKAITWDNKLEQESLNWVTQCEAGLDPSLRGVRGQTYYIAGANNPVNYQQVLTAWESEYINYKGEDGNAYKASNYTQMVWWSTYRVGCAVAVCPTLGEYWHCTWAPRGNFRGVKPHNSTCVPQQNPCGNVTCGRVSDGCQMVTCGAPCDTGCTSGACFLAAAPPAVEYVGCFIDSYMRDLSNLYFSHWAMTVDMCTTTCGDNGYTYAALQAGNQCFCSNTYGQFGTASDYECYMPCQGNAYQQCGAWWRNSVYSLKPREEDPKFIASSCVMVPQYQGCFVDDTNRDLQGSVYVSNDMTVELCTQMCNQQGFAVAGLQFATQCYCGSSFGAYGQASEGDCNVPCAGNGDQMCGGGWRNNIYKFVQQCIDDSPPIPTPVPVPVPVPLPVPVPVAPVEAPVQSNPPVQLNPPIPIPEPPPVNPPVSVPQDTKFSWTDRGFSTPTKYQDSCGSCWALEQLLVSRPTGPSKTKSHLQSYHHNRCLTAPQITAAKVVT